MSRTRRSFWSYLTSTAFSLTTVVVALVSTPLLLRWLGNERFGAYRAASDWTAYLGLFELGLGHALLPLLALSCGRGEGDRLRVTLATGIRAYAWIALAMLVAGVAMGLVIPRLVPVTPGIRGDLQQGFLLGLLAIVLVPLAPFRLLAEAEQKSYVVNSLLILQSLLITGLALVLAYQGWGITGQYLSAVAGAAIFSGAVTVFVSYGGRGTNGHTSVRDPTTGPAASQSADSAPPLGGSLSPLALLRAAAGKPDRAVRARLWKLNWPTLVHNACGRVSLLTDNIIIAALLGPTAVVPFFLTQRLAQLAQGQLQGIGNASWAGLAELHARGERQAVNARLIDLTSLVAILGVAGMVPILAYNRHFLQLWVPDSPFGGGWLTFLAVASGFLQGIFSLWGWMFCGTGQVARLIPVLVVGTSINLIASVLGTWLFGLPGPLVGTLISFVGIYSWFWPVLLRQQFGTSPRRLLKAVARPVAVGLPCAALVWWLARNHEPSGWTGLGCEMVTVSVAYLLLAWWLILDRTERQSWSHRARASLGWPRLLQGAALHQRGADARGSTKLHQPAG
jgi:O-antigen/teichoic acid export membrane protein